MEPTEADKSQAWDIAEAHMFDGDIYGLRDDIARALAAARIAPPGHVIDEDGMVRKIRNSSTNTNGPIYGTAMMLGETVMVLLPAEAARKAPQ